MVSPLGNLPVFLTGGGKNIDPQVVQDFGDEWTKFSQFDEKELAKIQSEYFDLLDDRIINKGTYGIDIGCGTGRWTKCLLDRIGFMEAIDPSHAVIAAQRLLAGHQNVRIAVASTDNIPFADGTFDFGMSIGVLHHIPDTAKALADCVKKIQIGGHFFIYLYYSLDNRGPLFRLAFRGSNLIRRIVSSMPGKLKRLSSDALAVSLYMPLVLAGRVAGKLGLKQVAARIPLSIYQNKSFHIIRNDALDRFGTRLEQRFSRKEVIAMMEAAGLGEIRVSDKMPYWHAIGQRVS